MRQETIVKIAAGLDIDAGELVSGLPLPYTVGARELTATIMDSCWKRWAGLTDPEGQAELPAVLSTVGNGMPSLALFLKSHKWVAVGTCWTVIIFETTFGLSLLHPAIAIVYIAIALTFHVAIAFAMGLNLFLFAFPATFPALLWAAGTLQPVLAAS